MRASPRIRFRGAGARLLEVVASSALLTAEALCARIVESVGDWSAGVPQHDDLTLGVLKVTRP